MTDVKLKFDPQPSGRDAHRPNVAEPAVMERRADLAFGAPTGVEMGSIAWPLLGAIVFAALVSAVALIVL
jgi:hypothetical protein